MDIVQHKRLDKLNAALQNLQDPDHVAGLPPKVLYPKIEKLIEEYEAFAIDKNEEFLNLEKELQDAELGQKIEEIASALHNASCNLQDALEFIKDYEEPPEDDTEIWPWFEDFRTSIQEALDYSTSI